MSESEYLLKRVDECQDKTRRAFLINDMNMAAFWSRAAIGFLKRYACSTAEELCREHVEVKAA